MAHRHKVDSLVKRLDCAVVVKVMFTERLDCAVLVKVKVTEKV